MTDVRNKQLVHLRLEEALVRLAGGFPFSAQVPDAHGGGEVAAPGGLEAEAVTRPGKPERWACAQTVRSLRLKAGLSQERLARNLGVDRGNLA
jgi:hypothetical protein